MHSYHLLAIMLNLGLFLFSCERTDIRHNNDEPVDYVSFVNPLMGTDSNYELSNDNTYPSIFTFSVNRKIKNNC